MKSIRRTQDQTKGRDGRKFAAGFLASSVTYLGPRSSDECAEAEYLFRLHNVADDLKTQTAFSFRVVLKQVPPKAKLPAIGEKWFDRRGTTLLISEVRFPRTEVAGSWRVIDSIKTPETLGLTRGDKIAEGRLRRALEMLGRSLEESTEAALFLYQDGINGCILAPIETWRQNPEILEDEHSEIAKDVRERLRKLHTIFTKHMKHRRHIHYEEAEPDTVHSVHQAIAYMDARALNIVWEAHSSSR